MQDFAIIMNVFERFKSNLHQTMEMNFEIILEILQQINLKISQEIIQENLQEINKMAIFRK